MKSVEKFGFCCYRTDKRSQPWLLLAILPLLLTGCLASEGAGLPADPFATTYDCLAVADFACANDALLATGEVTATAQGAALLELTKFLKFIQDEGNTLVTLAGIIASQNPGTGPWALAGDPLKGSALLNRAVYELLKNDWARLQERRTSMQRLLDRWDRFALPLTSVPVMVGKVPTFVIRGTITRSDFLLFKGWLDLSSVALGTLLSIDIDFPVGETVRYARSLDSCSHSENIANRRDCWRKVTAFAINNAGNFGRLEPDRGLVFAARTEEALASFYKQLQAFIESIRAESLHPMLAPGTRSLTWKERPHGGGLVRWKFGSVPIPADDIYAILNGDKILEPPFATVDNEVDFVVRSDAVTAITEMYGHLLTQTPTFVNFNRVILPPLLTAFEFLLQSDVSGTVIQLMAAGIDPDLARDLRRFLEDLRTFYSDYSNADALERLFEYIFPASLEINLHRLFVSDRFLQTFLPDAVSDGTFGDTPTWHWQVEWECPDQDIEVLFCNTTADLVDSAHFVGTPLFMPADGIRTPMAYIGYSDPTWNGMIRFDPQEVDPRFPSGVTAPNLEQLNQLFHEVGRELKARLE